MLVGWRIGLGFLLFGILTNPAWGLGNVTLGEPVSGANITGNLPCFSWSLTSGATHYTVQVSSDTAFNAASQRWVSKDITGRAKCWDTSFVPNATAGGLGQLEFGKTYYWRVKAMTGPTRSNPQAVFSSYRAFSTNIGVVAPVSPQINTQLSDNQPCFSWRTAVGASRYSVQISNDTLFNESSQRWVSAESSATSRCWDNTFQPNSTASNLSELEAGKTYYWRIKAIRDRAGLAPLTTFSTPRLLKTAIGQAQLVSPINNAEKQLSAPCFSWQHAAGATHYTVQVSSDTAFNEHSQRWVAQDWRSTQICWSNAFLPNENASHLSELETGKTYYWRIKSMNNPTGQNTSTTFTEAWRFTVGDSSAQPRTIKFIHTDLLGNPAAETSQ